MGNQKPQVINKKILMENFGNLFMEDDKLVPKTRSGNTSVSTP